MRRRHIGNLDAPAASIAIEEFLDDWQYLYNHVAIDELLVGRTMKLAEVHELRGYDAVQLTAAIALNERYQIMELDMGFVSADLELNAAAVSEGLQAENPDLHP